MTTLSLSGVSNRSFLTRFKPKQENFSALMIVYEVDKGDWRGFAYPYGETIQATTKNKTLKAIKELTVAYHDSIKKYNFPDHLISGHLINPMDQKVFHWVLDNKSFMSKIHSREGKADSKYCYVEAYRP